MIACWAVLTGFWAIILPTFGVKVGFSNPIQEDFRWNSLQHLFVKMQSIHWGYLGDLGIMEKNHGNYYIIVYYGLFGYVNMPWHCPLGNVRHPEFTCCRVLVLYRWFCV